MMHTLEALNRRDEVDQRARVFWSFVRELMLCGSKHAAIGRCRRSSARARPIWTCFRRRPCRARRARAHTSALAWARIAGRLCQHPPTARAARPAPDGAGGAAHPHTHFYVGAQRELDRVAVADSVYGAHVVRGYSEPTSIAAAFGVSAEWLRASGDRGLSALELALTESIKAICDGYLLDDQPAVSGTRPAGLLEGVTEASTLGDAVADLPHLWAAVRDGQAVRPTFICSPTAALYLAGLDSPLFRDVSALGAGRIGGVPQVACPAAENHLVLVDGNSLVVSDEGLLVDSSDQTSAMMDTTPTSPASMVSAFQTNAKYIRVNRLVFWSLAHEDGAAFIELPVGSPA